ncbi:hypothetical protein ONS95_003336 [Cadophora gregata]|nr:uncharacterized protein ONS95_003336 [Cadophora gregata]KAK0108532.1 hypothetical protein ONS95_003336 [Cadophora gregata]KAK0108872.1 hypothetical protein ONS96_002710 [Cadophora gregata f. sp. sojae]
MISKAGPKSDVTKACTTIALAVLGKKISDQGIFDRAQRMHTSLLRSFSLSISTGDTFISVESLITATLLGLYEIIINTDFYNGAHIAHAQGVAAILTSKSSPFDLVCGGKLFRALNNDQVDDWFPSKLPNWQHTPPNPKTVTSKFSILCTPLSRHEVVTIDEIFAKTEPLFRRAEALLARDATLDELYAVMRDAESLRDEYNIWIEKLPEQWKPRLVGTIAAEDGAKTQVGYWPGTITKYHDPYIATIWNSYRKARLLVINIIMDCYNRICTFPEHEDIDPAIYADIDDLITGLLLSIPFVLSSDVQSFVQNAATRAPLIPGKSVGGLMLTHTLYVLSVLPIIDPSIQVYMRECIAWIGEHMRIGQAVILSKCATDDLFDYVTEAHVLLWAGMLI